MLFLLFYIISNTVIWGKLEVLETFRALIWVLAKTTRKTLWWTLRSRGLTFTRNATEAFKNSRFTNMEKGLWARPLLNHIFVVSLVFLCIPWHKFTALIFLWKFFFFFFFYLFSCLSLWTAREQEGQLRIRSLVHGCSCLLSTLLKYTHQAHSVPLKFILQHDWKLLNIVVFSWLFTHKPS